MFGPQLPHAEVLEQLVRPIVTVLDGLAALVDPVELLGLRIEVAQLFARLIELRVQGLHLEEDLLHLFADAGFLGFHQLARHLITQAVDLRVEHRDVLVQQPHDAVVPPETLVEQHPLLAQTLEPLHALKDVGVPVHGRR